MNTYLVSCSNRFFTLNLINRYSKSGTLSSWSFERYCSFMNCSIYLFYKRIFVNALSTVNCNSAFSYCNFCIHTYKTNISANKSWYFNSRCSSNWSDFFLTFWNEPWMIGVLQNTLIDQVLDDQELVRDSFCEMIATILEERVDKSVWSFSVYLILFLIVSPIMTLVFRVVSFLSWIVLHVLKLLWVFKWKKRMRWIKELV